MEKIVGTGPIALYLFFYLLPGLFGSMVYDYILEGEKRENIDRVASALVLTLASAMVLHYAAGAPIVPSFEVTNETRVDALMNAFLGENLLRATLLSTVIALVFGALNNHGLLYLLLRAIHITYKTGDGDIWQQTFYKFRGCWISIEFKDGRRLVGWPKFFSSTGKQREILVADATWWSQNDAGEFVSMDVIGPGVYLSTFDDVVSIEILD